MDMYFVCLVVVSRIVDCDHGILVEMKGPDDFIDSELFTPFLTFREHQECLGDIEFTRSKETEL